LKPYLRPHLLAALASAFAVSNCGGGGGGTAAPPAPAPSLTLVSMSPTGAYSGNNPGTVSVSGSVNATGPAIGNMEILMVNSSGTTVATTPASFSSMPQSTISFSGSVDTSKLPLGTYTLEVQATATSGGVSKAVGQPFQLIAYPWSSGTPMPTTLTDYAVAAVGTQIYLLTGLATGSGAGTATTTIQIYDSATGSWTAGPFAPTARAGAVAATVGTKIYLIGGYNSSSPMGIAQVDIYDTQSGTWSIGSAEPTPRFYSGICAIGSLIYVLGGTQDSTEGVQLNLFESLDTTTGTWTSLPLIQYYPIPDHAGCAVDSGKLYMAGGNSGANGSAESIGAFSFDPTTSSWSVLNFFQYNRTRHATVSVAGQVILMGGLSDAGGVSGPTAVTEAYSISSGTWRARAPMPTPTQDLSGAQINGVVYDFAPASTYIYQALQDTL
jgi:N-acetylneuraminic acid mutarotase